MRLAFIVFSIFMFSFSAQAKKRYFNSLSSFYSDYPAVKKRKCQNCHAKTSLRLNGYGQDFASVRSDFSDIKDAFAEIEPWDSDEDGPTNIEEITDGTHQGVSDQD